MKWRLFVLSSKVQCPTHGSAAAAVTADKKNPRALSRSRGHVRCD